MIPWRTVQKENFKDWEVLAQFLNLDEAKAFKILPSPKFPLNIPLRLAKKIKKNCLNDPILRQFLPLNQEKEKAPDYLIDPVLDASFRKSGKL